jgi:hypothetical protein
MVAYLSSMWLYYLHDHHRDARSCRPPVCTRYLEILV